MTAAATPPVPGAAAAASPAARSVAARGIGLALLSYACFSTSDAAIKLSSARFSVFQIALTLSLFALVPVLLLTRGQGGLRALVPTLPRLVLLRGLLTAACALLCWQAFSLMPLADGYAILFASPVLVTALSVPLLGERVGWRRWVATGVGFAGVLLMIRPDFAAIGAGHALALAAVLFGSLSFVVLRKIGPREKSAPVIAGVFVAIALMSAPLAVRDFVPPTGAELLLLALAGLLQGAGQAGLVLATREAPAAVVAPFQYSQMLWAVVFGFVLFGDVPQPVLFAGLALVVGSGLYTVWRETVRRLPVTLTAGRGEVPARAAR
jgi:S-adenosylmethionine uptake transporter